jgi:hypothetical protein
MIPDRNCKQWWCNDPILPLAHRNKPAWMRVFNVSGQHEMRALMRIVLLATSLAVLLVNGSAFAADEKPLPPPNAKKLSEIIAKVEQRNDFRYVKEVDWDSGVYTVTYYSSDKAKVEISYDPVTGETK